MVDSYTCAQCGGTFLFDDTPDEEKQTEALQLWGQRGDAPGMVLVCEECFLEVLKQAIPMTKGES